MVSSQSVRACLVRAHFPVGKRIGKYRMNERIPDLHVKCAPFEGLIEVRQHLTPDGKGKVAVLIHNENGIVLGLQERVVTHLTRFGFEVEVVAELSDGLVCPLLVDRALA